MTWHNDRLWEHERAERARLKREAFAASVEEVSQKPLEFEEWEEERDLSAQDATFVPPRLRLQSRPNPTRPIAAMREQDLLMNQSTPVQEPRQASRVTRVRLQAAFPGQPQETEHIPSIENTPPAAQAASAPGGLPGGGRTFPNSAGASARPWPRLLGGRGLIKQGQAAVSVPNAAISERSVVTVMLAGNPGPVMVQYISLHPRMGFTVHLTSAATANAPFNYVIWPF